jgi:hypothetical protein
MKVIGDFNNLSKEMKAAMPKLKKGEVKTFIKVNGVINKDPDSDWRAKMPVSYCTEQIPTRARITDWHTGEFVDVGVPEKWNKEEGVIKTRFFMPGLGEHHFMFTGMFSLSGDKPADVELYEFLAICPSNESNVQRDTSEPAIFKEINVAATSRAMIEDTDLLLAALQGAKAMSVAEAKLLAAALVWPNYDEVTVKAKVLEYAKTYPADFLRICGEEGTKEKAEVKVAFDKDILDYDWSTGDVKMGQSVLTRLDIRDGSNFVEAFYEYAQGAANGKEILKTIRKQLKAKEQAEQKAAV